MQHPLKINYILKTLRLKICLYRKNLKSGMNMKRGLCPNYEIM